MQRMTSKELRQLSTICGWKAAKQLATVNQWEWKKWCMENASLKETSSVMDGTKYTFTLKKATFIVFVDYYGFYQELTVKKGKRSVDLL